MSYCLWRESGRSGIHSGTSHKMNLSMYTALWADSTCRFPREWRWSGKLHGQPGACSLHRLCLEKNAGDFRELEIVHRLQNEIQNRALKPTAESTKGPWGSCWIMEAPMKAVTWEAEAELPRCTFTVWPWFLQVSRRDSDFSEFWLHLQRW